MGYRGWFTKVERDDLENFRGLIRKNPNAYGIYYTIDVAVDLRPFTKGLWVAWTGDGDGSVNQDMPNWVRDPQRTIFLDDVLTLHPDWRKDPGRYGRCDFRVTAGGLSLAEGKSIWPRQPEEAQYVEDWFCTADDWEKAHEAEKNSQMTDVSAVPGE
jgi:hypothetical protein